LKFIVRRSVLLLAMALAGILPCISCATTDTELKRELAAERNEELSIVSRGDLDAHPADSPQRTILTLWRAIQFRDAQGAIALFTPPPTKSQRSGVESFLVGSAAVTAATSTPRFVNVDRTRSRATVVVQSVERKKVGSGVTTSVEPPLRFALARRPSGWKIRWLRLVSRLTGGRIVLRPGKPVTESPAPSGKLDPRVAPGRTALAWWEALRKRDAGAVVGLLSRPARRRLERHATEVAVRGRLGRWASATEARVLYAEGSGDAVTVFMMIEGGDRIGHVLAKRGALMLALPVVKHDGRWLVDDSVWLRTQVELYRALRSLERRSSTG
jgi:hypothetical protein